MEKISFIIPCYNESDSVGLLYKEILKTFKKTKIDVELIFINDGSKDNTDYEIKKLLNKENVIYINFSRNFGKESAIYAGLENATGDYITIIDADLQQHPNVVKEMYQEIKKDNTLDCVATYQKKRKDGFIKKICSKSFYKVANKLVTIEMADNSSDFRLFKRNVLDAMLKFKEHKRFTKGIFSWIGFNVKYIEYEPLERQFGQSKWKISSLFKYAFDGILSYSEKILLIPMYLGIFNLMPIKENVQSYFIEIINLFEDEFAKYDTLKNFDNTSYSLVIFLSSINFFLLGIIAIYISRIYIEVQNRPIYVAKEILYSSNIKDKK